MAEQGSLTPVYPEALSQQGSISITIFQAKAKGLPRSLRS